MGWFTAYLKRKRKRRIPPTNLIADSQPIPPRKQQNITITSKGSAGRRHCVQSQQPLNGEPQCSPKRTHSRSPVTSTSVQRIRDRDREHHPDIERVSRDYTHRQRNQPQCSSSSDRRHSSREMFCPSKCSGRKKAVCIGIDYRGSSKPLEGCVNDAHNVCKFLTKDWGFGLENIRILTDDNEDPTLLPTKANMLAAMSWLVEDARAHDSLFFHYSGHGGLIRDTDGDEVDGYDEIIFPLNYEKKGVGIITDDVMNKLMVHPLPNGCRLTALFDSCHSGSILDLVHCYHSDGRLMDSPVSRRFLREMPSSGDVICFSGCGDSETSADMEVGGLAVGAMSYAFLTCLNETPKQSYKSLLKGIRKFMRKGYKQRPQLSASHPIDIRDDFIL